MTDYLLRTSGAIQDCEQHLSASGANGSPIESYLTQHIVVILCAEMQQEIYKLVDQKAKKNTDKLISNFVSSTQKKVLKSIETGAITGFIRLFSPDQGEIINKALSPQEVSMYNNVVDRRNAVAHKFGATITFLELKNAIDIAKKILITLQKVFC